MRILILEDDAPVAKFLSDELKSEHYNVQIAATGVEVRQLVEENECDLVILSLNHPDSGSMNMLRELRAAKPHLPVLILSGSTRVEDRVCGLDSGADDYLTKPFAFSELSARVRALLRRGNLPFQPVLRCSDLELDRLRHVVNRKGHVIELTAKEFALLEYLMLNAGRSVSRSSIISNVWKLSLGSQTNVVDVYINYLRRKIDNGAKERLLHTVRGAGYYIGEQPAAGR